MGRMYKSPLLKTVQRHSRIAAVTHSPGDIPVAPGLEQEQNLLPVRSAGTEQPVKASWVPATASLGKSILTTPSIPGEGEPAPRQPEMPEKPIRLPVDAEAKIIEPSGTARRDTPPPQKVGDEDNLWRRLQTIFNRHQEKELQEESLESDTQPDAEKRTEAEPAEQISKPAEASQTANSPGSTAASEPTAGPIQRKEASPHEENLDNQPAAPFATGKAAAQLNQETEPQTKAQTGASSPATLDAPAERQERSEVSEVTTSPIAENPAIQTQADPQTTSRPRIASLSEVPRPSDDAKIAADARETHIPAGKMSLGSSAADATSNEPINTTDEEMAPNEDPLEDGISLHPSPLQSVWPVQQKADEPVFQDALQPSIPFQADEPAESVSTFAVPNRDAVDKTPLSQDFGHIQSRLEQVRTTPSDSSIEYIPPRRPRPLSQAAQQSKPAKLVQRQLEDADTHMQPVQPEAEIRPVENAASFETIQPSPSEMKEGDSRGPVDKLPITPTLPLQRLKNESSSPEMVGTEIGDLPADLWKLIGENPPDRSATSSATIHSPAQSRSKQTHSSASQVMRTPDGSFAAQAVSQSPQAQTIQLQAEQTAALTQAEPGRKPAPRDDQDKPIDQEVDIQELAKKVYSEIKQKLALEWERRRF